MFNFNKSKTIANYIIHTLNDQSIEITHLKLQKLLYFCQKESLKKYNKALFEDDFEAWIHGPVLPSIYKIYACYGWNNIPSGHFIPILFSSEKEIIKSTLNKYKMFSGKELELLSHKDYSWINARKGSLFYQSSNTIITKNDIKNS